MNVIDRMTVQTLTTKLDLNQITPKEAKAHLKKFSGLTITGRTREDVIRAMGRELREAEALKSNAPDDLLSGIGNQGE
jgi:hypothetical protein